MAHPKKITMLIDPPISFNIRINKFKDRFDVQVRWNLIEWTVKVVVGCNVLTGYTDENFPFVIFVFKKEPSFKCLSF
jgi:hypothetical protein